MSDSDKFEEATNIIPQPKPISTGTPTWLWFVLALLAAALIAGAGFIGATIEGNAKDKTISAVENSLVLEQSTATEAKNFSNALQEELENEQQLAADNHATAEARATLIAHSDATAAAADHARATQEAIAGEELSARETSDAGSTAIALTAQADSDARATAEAQASDSAATAEAESVARATQEQIAIDAQSAAERSGTQITDAKATEAALRADLANAQMTVDAAATEVAEAGEALATQESRAIENAGTASAAQIETNRLQATANAGIAAQPGAPTPTETILPSRMDVTTQLVRSDTNLFSIRLPLNWPYEEDLATDSLSEFYFGQTDGEMMSMRSDDTAAGIGGAIYFFEAAGDNSIEDNVEASLEFTIDFYLDNGAQTITDPDVFTLADGRPVATQTVSYNSQHLYIYVVGMNRMIVVGLLTEPSVNDGSRHAQLEQIMVSLNTPPASDTSSGISNSFNLSAESQNLPQTVTTSDGRLTLHLPSGWEVEDTLSSDNVVSYTGDLSFGSVLVVEEEPDTFQANSIVAEMSLMTFGVNRIILETGGHLLAEPGIYERSDGVTIVYCLAQDSFGLIRWTAVYVFENDNIVVAQVNYLGASTFPQVRDRLLAIVLSLDFSPQATGNSPSG